MASASENGREINQELKTLYDSSLFDYTRGATQFENMNSYFSHLLEDEDEHTVIEMILTTSLDRFGIFRFYLKKLTTK